MTINYDRLMGISIPEAIQTYTVRDTILYALGIGLGSDPINPQHLRFVYEKNLEALPSMAVVLAHPGFWVRDLDTGITWVKVVHGEQDVVIHRPLPPHGTVVGRTRVLDVYDKGPGREALMLTRRDIYEKSSGDHLASIDQLYFCRGDGGFGGPPPPARTPVPAPTGAPSYVVDCPTLPQIALIYRLSGDWNPLHADPDIAAQAGFSQPILHGLGTYGVATHALLKAVCNYDPKRLLRIGTRFSAPAIPGDTFRIEIWKEDEKITFRGTALERGITVLQNGVAELRPVAAGN